MTSKERAIGILIYMAFSLPITYILIPLFVIWALNTLHIVALGYSLKTVLAFDAFIILFNMLSAHFKAKV